MLSGVDEPSVPEISGPAEPPDHGPAAPPSGQGSLVAGVSPQTSSQHQHEASQPQPLLVPVLPPRHHHSSPHPLQSPHLHPL